MGLHVHQGGPRVLLWEASRSSMELGNNYNQDLTGRNIKAVDKHYELREQEIAYHTYFAPENGWLSLENIFYLGLKDEKSI